VTHILDTANKNKIAGALKLGRAVQLEDVLAARGCVLKILNSRKSRPQHYLTRRENNSAQSYDYSQRRIPSVTAGEIASYQHQASSVR
jgi:hypothetical protein